MQLLSNCATNERQTVYVTEKPGHILAAGTVHNCCPPIQVSQTLAPPPRGRVLAAGTVDYCCPPIQVSQTLASPPRGRVLLAGTVEDCCPPIQVSQTLLLMGVS